jgi:hypothetical protein
MQFRPLTVEEYAIAGVSTRHCMKCGDERPHSAPRDWMCYYRKEGSPRTLCEYCLQKQIDRPGVSGAAFFVSPEAAATYELKAAHEIPGLPQKTPEQVERAVADFRSLSPAEIQAMSMQIPLEAKPGDCLEIFGPIFWFAIMRCLEWLRESCDLQLPFMLKRWEKWPVILEKNVGEPKYQAWKTRLAAMAESEFSFRYNVLLSDSIEAARVKAEAKRAPEAKARLFEDCKASVGKYPPPASFPGGEDDYQRFVEYIDAMVARLRPPHERPPGVRPCP